MFEKNNASVQAIYDRAAQSKSRLFFLVLIELDVPDGDQMVCKLEVAVLSWHEGCEKNKEGPNQSAQPPLP